MEQSDYLEHDAVGLAGLIARREVSAAEVLEAAVGRLEAVNPAINAVIYTDLAAARAEAGQARAGPLAGVPFLVKDYAAHVGGFIVMLDCCGLGASHGILACLKVYIGLEGVNLSQSLPERQDSKRNTHRISFN